MRRWQEFGHEGSFFNSEPWYDKNGFQEGGFGQPVFISMPHKSKTLGFMNAIAATQLFQPGGMVCMMIKQEDQGVDPDPSCGAQHIPRAYSNQVTASPPMILSPISFLLGGCPIFSSAGIWTGGFGPFLFTFYFEPPDKFGG